MATSATNTTRHADSGDSMFRNLTPPPHLVKDVTSSSGTLSSSSGKLLSSGARAKQGAPASSQASSSSFLTPASSSSSPPSPSSSSSSSSSPSPSASAERRGGRGRGGGRETEGYDYEFSPRADSKFQCPICMMVLRNPVQTPCGHRYCKACIQRWFRERHHPPCPVCNLKLQEVFPDNFAKREISNLTVVCPNKAGGCTELITLGQLEHHVESLCLWSAAPCPLQCPATLLRSDVTDHLTNHCPLRHVSCRYCGLHVIYTHRKVHAAQCPEMEVECEFCQQVLLRKEMDSHQQACPLVVVACTYQVYGCDFKSARADMAAHESASTTGHLRLISQLLKPGAAVSLTTHSSHHHHHPLSYASHPLTWPTATPPGGGGGGGGDGGMLSSYNDHGFCSGLSSTVTSISSAPLSAAAQRSTTGLHESPSYDDNNLPSNGGGGGGDGGSFGREDSRIYRDPSTGWTAPLTKRELHHTKHGGSDSLPDKVSELHKLVRKYESRLLQYEKTIAELSSRSYNGVYIWKILDYQRRRRDAVAAKATVTNSPGFYSSGFGYKVCMRVNLNGVETGTGKYLSLFIHFMQGEFDDLLDWPFQGKITLSILDRRECVAKRQDISEMLSGKADLAAFQRPQASRNNKGYGYIEFAPINVIESGVSYVKDDSLFIKAIIQEKQ